MDDDKSSLECATPAEVSAIAREKQVEWSFPKARAARCSGLSDPPVDRNELSIHQPRMDGARISAYPEHIGNGEVRDTGELVQRPPQEERDFLPPLEKKIQESVLLSKVSLGIRGIGFLIGGGLSRTMNSSESVRSRLCESEAARSQEIGKTDGVGDAQRQDFLDVAWRGESVS